MTFDEVLEDLLRDGYSVRFVAEGDSMHPTIRSGDKLHITAPSPDSLRPGEVVLVRADRGLTAHRIVRIDAASVVTRGDNALADDRPVAPAAIAGRVTSIERNGLPLAIPRRRLYLQTLARRAARVVRRLVGF